ncbi:hypothetical protein BGW39_004755 [Mortierella sp. 14UC]|nr:hypothetical protein BGW39_004755 [Mortierella sp. 14UC]
MPPHDTSSTNLKPRAADYHNSSTAGKLIHLQKVFVDPDIELTAEEQESEQCAQDEEASDNKTKRPFQRYGSGINTENIFLGTLYLRNHLRYFAYHDKRYCWPVIPGRHVAALTTHITEVEPSLRHVKNIQLACLYKLTVDDRRELDSIIKDSKGALYGPRPS